MDYKMKNLLEIIKLKMMRKKVVKVKCGDLKTTNN